MFDISEKDIERFWSYVDKRSTGCWEWTGGRRGGYGIFRLRGSTVSSHRLSYFLANGPFKHLVLHRCDNPPCVNPDHLFIGTHRDNTDDAFQKGRRERAKPRRPKEYRKATKISSRQIEEIQHALSDRPYWGQVNDLAKKYGVSHSRISQIKAGTHLPKKVSKHEDEN